VKTSLFVLILLTSAMTDARRDDLELAQVPEADERAIVRVIADRQAAWNAGDEQAYARLLTEDADLASSTGRYARGRESVIQLYREQRQGTLAGASTRMRVDHIRLVRPDVALVEAERELTGLQTASVAAQSRTTFVLVKGADGRWLITAQRANATAR
jgi:uncharacterized protein (TIGR02246 family)